MGLLSVNRFQRDVQVSQGLKVTIVELLKGAIVLCVGMGKRASLTEGEFPLVRSLTFYHVTRFFPLRAVTRGLR